ncbi:hypothetical protein BX600DRAFT_464021 [Xylariales sp. PMI_506]|nr:hypothetical protein BX600DRAFT_464021 [Xylariales sp. PMI_506]
MSGPGFPAVGATCAHAGSSFCPEPCMHARPYMYGGPYVKGPSPSQGRALGGARPGCMQKNPGRRGGGRKEKVACRTFNWAGSLQSAERTLLDGFCAFLGRFGCLTGLGGGQQAQQTPNRLGFRGGALIPPGPFLATRRTLHLGVSCPSVILIAGRWMLDPECSTPVL